MIKSPAAIKRLEEEFIKKEGKIPFEKSL